MLSQRIIRTEIQKFPIMSKKLNFPVVYPSQVADSLPKSLSCSSRYVGGQLNGSLHLPESMGLILAAIL